MAVVSSEFRIWEAKSIERLAFSTAAIACVGSVACPVATCCASVVAVAWVFSSELIAPLSALPKLPLPVLGVVVRCRGHGLVPRPPTLHSLAPSGADANPGDIHRRSCSVDEYICLVVSIAVTFAW